MPSEGCMVRLEGRGVSLNVRMRASEDSLHSPLVLLHGWPGSSAGWEGVVDRLPEDRTIIYPDLRGLGDSERAGDVAAFEKRALADDIAALIDALGVEDVAVAGQDWGGVIAQELALAMPERVKALIVMNINLINHPQANLKGLKGQMLNPKNPRWYMAFQGAPDLAEAMIPGAEAEWLSYIFGQAVPEGATFPEDLLEEYVRAYRIEGTARCGANYYRAMQADAMRWMSLGQAKFAPPSLILYGEDDPFITPEFYAGYEACFEDVRRVDIAAGHFVQDEKPGQVAEAIAAFLAEVGA